MKIEISHVYPKEITKRIIRLLSTVLFTVALAACNDSAPANPQPPSSDLNYPPDQQKQILNPIPTLPPCSTPAPKDAIFYSCQ